MSETETTLEGAESMMGATLGAYFRCCVCKKTHAGLEKGLSTVESCFHHLSALAGFESRRRRGRRIFGRVTVSFHHSDLARVLFPEQTKMDELDLGQFKHFLAAPGPELAVQYLKKAVEDWKAHHLKLEAELMAQDIETPPFLVGQRYNSTVLEIPTDRNVFEEITDVEVLTRLLKDEGAAMVALPLLQHGKVLEFCWSQLQDPVKILIRLHGSKDTDLDPSGVYLVSKKHKAVLVPRTTITTVKDAEAFLASKVKV